MKWLWCLTVCLSAFLPVQIVLLIVLIMELAINETLPPKLPVVNRQVVKAELGALKVA